MERWAALVKEHWVELVEEVEKLERGGVKASSAELIKKHWAAIKKRAALVEDAKSDHGRVTADQFVWCGSDDPIALLVGEPQLRRPPLKRPKRGRHSADRYAALLLAVIFHEYTGDPPTRKWNARKKMETSPFYVSSSIAFPAIGLPTPWSALHDVCKRWDRSRDFYKRAMEVLLFGGLEPKEGERLPRPRRKKSPPASNVSN